MDPYFVGFESSQLIRLGHALLHFLWQGAVVAGVAGASLSLMRRWPSSRRYAVLGCLFTAMAFCPLVTFCLISVPDSEESLPQAVFLNVDSPSMLVTDGSADVPIPLPLQAQEDLELQTIAAIAPPVAVSAAAPPMPSQMILVVAMWSVGVCLLSLRLIVGWVNTFRVRWTGSSAVPVDIQAMFLKLSETMAVRKTVRVCESALVQVPVVVGWLRPLILLPVRLVSGLSEEQLHAILAHELAHIRRHDYLVNFAQIFIENLLFYHPAVWWLSHRIRQEREHCCDDIAASACGGTVVLARALTTLAELHAATPHTLPAATGGSLVTRIRRLVHTESEPDSVISGGLESGALFASGLILALIMLIELPVSSADDEITPNSSTSISVSQTRNTDAPKTVSFEDLHRIPDGRVLHRVPSPRIPEARKRYETAVGPKQVAAMQEGASGTIWQYDGQETKLRSALFGGADGHSLIEFVQALAGVEMSELEGDAKLWLKKISADFVIRDGATQDQIISDLQRILNDELKLRVTLRFEEVERPVLIASGKFDGKPAGPSMQFQAKPRATYLLYGKMQDERPSHQMGKYDDFWKAISLRVGQRIVDESENAPRDYLQWLLSYDHPETTVWNTIPPRQFSANANVVLTRLSEQTGLTFEKGQRRIRVLSLRTDERPQADAPNTSSPVVPQQPARSAKDDVQNSETAAPVEASTRPESIPLEVWNRLPQTTRERMSAMKLFSEKESNDQAEHIELSKDWPLRFPENVQLNELAGVILDSEGNPLAGALVDLFPAFTGHETKTDEQGMFRYKFARAKGANQTVEVRFSKDGYSPVFRKKQLLGVEDFRVVLNSRTWLEGIVTDESGQPVANAEVTVGHPANWNATFPSFNRETVTVTDRDGRYRAYLWPEAYTVSIFTKDHGVARIPNVKVKKNQGQRLDVSLQPAVTFRARVIDAATKTPVAGLTLYHRTRPDLRGTSNAEGLLEIPGALPGRDEFQIGTTPPKLNHGYFKSPTAPFGSWWSPDAVKSWHRTSTTEVAIMFDLSRDMPTIELNVRAGVVIAGKVTDPNGKPVAEATVSAARTGTGNSLTGDTRFSVRTLADGTYVINLPPSGDGQYNLIAHDGAYSEWRSFANGTTEPISTKPGQRIEGVNIALHQPAMVRGKVTAPNGQSVKGLQVRAHAHDKRGNRYYDPSTRTAADGTFEIGFIRPGKHYIQVEPMWMKAEEGPAEAWTIIELKEGETKEDVQLRSVAKE